jgi:hypothetical protein
MKASAAARVELAGHTRCPKCNAWIRDTEIIDGVFPEHYLIGKIPCGWRDAVEQCVHTGEGDAFAESELSNDELDTDYEVWANQ